MHLFLTSVLPFLAHDHASAAAFLTCRHHNFHASIIPEFLSDEERVDRFCEVRQQNQLEVEEETPYKNLYNLFVQTPLMQFSPSLVLRQRDCVESILKPLLATKYFTRTLQRCSIRSHAPLTTDLLQGLSKVQSLIKLDIGGWDEVKNEHLEIIVNSFTSIHTLAIRSVAHLEIADPGEPAIKFISPPPPVTKTLRNFTLNWPPGLVATQFIPHFPNLRKLVLYAYYSCNGLDLLSLSASVPLLTDLSLEKFTLQSTEPLKNLAHLSSLQFLWCCMPDLNFLTQDSCLPTLSTLRIFGGHGLLTTSFASLSHAPNLHVLEINSNEFKNDCLQYLENMVHLRKLKLKGWKITFDSESFKTLMQNLFQLEELDLSECKIGNLGALYSTHSRLRVLNVAECHLVDDDLNGISLLKNTLEVLDLSSNGELTSKGLEHCKDLMKLKILNLYRCAVDDLSSLRGCLNLEKLNISWCERLSDDSFRVFSEEPNSFPNLRVLELAACDKLTEKLFEHLARNNHLVYQLKELNVRGISETVSLYPSATASNNISQLRGLRELRGIDFFHRDPDSMKIVSKRELTRRLKNIEELVM